MNNKRYLVLLVITIITAITVTTNLPITVFANNEEETVLVRIGYTENYGFIKYPTIEGNEGYGYEYFNKINEFTDTNYEFEYILCAWSDGLEMLENGELDILGPAHFTEEREQFFTYSQNPIGKDMLILASLDPDYLTESSYQKLNNGTVLIREGDASLPILQQYFNDNDLETQIIQSEDMDIQYELERQEYDFLFSGSMQMEVNLNIVMTLGSSPVYLMANKNCQDIIDDFDLAILQIADNEYLFQEQLYLKYFNHNTINNDYIDDDEYALLQSQPLYKVGVENLYTGIGITDSDLIDGLYLDIVTFIANKAEINVEFHEINKNTSETDLAKLDFYLPVNTLTYVGNKRQSDSYMQTPIIIVESDNYDKESIATIGVLGYYGLDESNIKYITNEKSIKVYDNLEDLISAFTQGEITKIMLTDATYRISYQDIAKRDHTIKSTAYHIDPKIAYSNGFDDDKIEVINKLITYINDEFVETALLKHVALANETLYNQAMKTYVQLIFGIILISAFIVHYVRQHRKNELEKLSNIDELTGLLTAQKFNETVANILKDDLDNEYTLITLDIDNFKYINEIYSFDVGSTILKLTANHLQAYATDELPVARLSNDTFVMLVKNISVENRCSLLDELNSNSEIHKNFHMLIDKSYYITFSIGCYNIIDRKLEINYMLDCCNLARSYSKETLGIALNFFSDDMREKESIKNNIVSRMNQAIIDKEFVLFYQPKFNINTQAVVGAEALVRWFVDDKMMPPNDFIPLFEENGFIETLDYYVLETACEFICKYADKNLPTISVNLSGVTIMKHDVVLRIIDIVKSYNVSPKCLDLEITESAFVNQFDLAISRIDELRAFGFTISMDDFGAGISSLGRLKGISLDILKIDREFIIESFENEKADKIFRNIINMAKDLELETVAEGIETAEQLEFLKEISCDVGQGYFFSRPLPEKDFIALLIEKLENN